MSEQKIKRMPKLPGRQSPGNGAGPRIRVAVDVGDMGMEGEPNVIDKQGDAVVWMIDWIEKCCRQSMHDLVVCSQATIEAGDSANAAIEGQFVQRRPRNVEAKYVERGVELGNRVVTEIE